MVWTGPVYSGQVVGAIVPGAETLFLQCSGAKTASDPHCPSIGAQLQSSPASLYVKGAVTGAPDELFLASFSAGGSVLKRLLSNPEYRRDATVVTLFDSTYTGAWESPGKAPPIAGFVQYAVDVAASGGEKLFVATASHSPNKNWPTGIQTLAAVRRAVQEQTGQEFERTDDFFGVDPGPEAVYRLGNVIFAEFPMDPLGHGHTKIAGQVYEKIVVPWLSAGRGIFGAEPGPVIPGDSRPGVAPPEPSPFSGAVPIVLGFVLGATVARLGWVLYRNSKRK